MGAAVLIVDDEANIRRMLAALLESEGYQVASAPDGALGLEAIRRDQPDVLLLDLMLPDANGIDLLEIIARDNPGLPVVMMSGRATLSDAVRATKLGAFHFIEKPLSPEAVLMTVKGAIDLRSARDRARALAAELTGGHELIGASAALEAIRQLIERIAPTDARVLVTGESGTGKELVAAALHARSPRAHGPFIRINSAAIPRELVESEMFGHERGAFSGAHQARRGRFELADGGTLFLDEIADLSAEAQAKLLRAIESGEFQRVGGERTRRADVRIIAATNRDLKTEVASGRFRDDLFYRLNVVPLELPPLRTRREDIPALVHHFMARLQAQTGRPTPRLRDEALDALRAYNWPGNVRELANICERLSILYPGLPVEARDVTRILPHPSADQDESQRALHERLDEYERQLIFDALAAADGNVAEAARRLDTDRPNLYRRMRRLGIDR